MDLEEDADLDVDPEMLPLVDSSDEEFVPYATENAKIGIPDGESESDTEPYDCAQHADEHHQVLRETD